MASSSVLKANESPQSDHQWSSNIEKLANITDKERLLSIIYTLSNLENDIKYSSQRLILFEVGIIKLCSGTIEENHSGNIDDNEVENLKKICNEVFYDFYR